MKRTSKCESRARQLRRLNGYRPRVELLEERLPPGDTVLGGLVARSLFGPSLIHPGQVPALPVAVAGKTEQGGVSVNGIDGRTSRAAHVAKLVDAMIQPAQLKTISGVTYVVMSQRSQSAGSPQRTGPFEALSDFDETSSIRPPRPLLGVDEGDSAEAGARAAGTAAFGLAPDRSETIPPGSQMTAPYEAADSGRGAGIVVLDVSPGSPSSATAIEIDPRNGGDGPPPMPKGPIPPDSPPTDDCDDCDCSCSSGGAHGIGGPPDSGLGPPHKGPGGHGPVGKAPGAPGIPSSLSFSAAPVRYFDGTIKLVTDDLPPSDLGTPWGHTRSWTNSPGYTGRIDPMYTPLSQAYNGNGMVVSQLPFVESANASNQAIVIRAYPDNPIRR